MIELGIIFILVVVILVVGFGLLHLGRTSAPKTPPPSAFAATNFTPTQMYLDNAGGAGIALNESTKTVCVIQSSTLPPRLVHFTDLVASFVLKNDAIIHNTQRSHPKEFADIAKDSQGQLGSEPRQMPTSPSPSDQTQKIDLCLVIHDQENPIHIINFLDMDTKEEGIIVNKAMVSAKHWHHLMSDLIHKANGEDRSPGNVHKNQNDTQTPVPLVADELTKLNDLLDKNVISQSDFNIQKEKLLTPH